MNVLVSDEGVVRTITLNRPERRNAIDIPLRVELADVVEAADADPDVRAIVLTGAGGSFCSGGDISTMEPMPIGEAEHRMQLAQRVIRAIWTTPKPVVAAIEGSAFGAGVALAAACDRVVAASDARFAATFTGVGLAGDMGIFASLPRRVGVARARQMLLMPEPMTGQEAVTCGLADVVAEPGQALTRARADAARLGAGPAQAYGVIKASLAVTPALRPVDVLDWEVDHQAPLFGSDDFAEGIAAYRQKRRPVFGTTQGVHP